MIKKQRDYPLSALILEALLRRLPPDHEKRKWIEKDLQKIVVGFRGEQSLDYYLNFLEHDTYLIFHDVRLPIHNHHFQMDSLIISSHFIFILEIKNLYGKITFDPQFNQLIRDYNDVKEVFPDPVIQVENHKQQLRKWLHQYNFTVPIYTSVVISNPKTIIQANTANQDYLQKIIRSTNIVSTITKTAKKHPNPVLSDKDLRKITRLVLKQHAHLHKNELKKYQLTEEELLRGVRCPKCDHIPLTKKGKLWICCQCSYQGTDAIIHSLFDYYLIVRPTITNAQLRKFFELSSTSISAKLLSSLKLPRTGSTKNTQHHLSRDYFESKIR